MSTEKVGISSSLIFVTALVSATFVLLAQSLTQAVSNYWTDSEIWAVASSRLLFQSADQFEFGMKPLFHFTLWLSSQLTLPLSSGDFQSLAPALDGARGLMILNAIFLAFTLFWIGRQLFSPSVGIAALLLLLLNPNFLQNMTAIRSDLLAIPWILWCYLNLAQKNRGVGILCFVIACLITPKAGLFIVPLFAVGRLWFTKPTRQEGLVGLCLLLLIGGLLLFQWPSLQLAFEHFTNEAKTEQMGMSYWAAQRWIYWIEALNQAGWFWLSLFILVPMGLKVHARQRGHIYPLLLFSIFSLLILLLNPSKLPFLIASYLPIFALAICALVVTSLRRFPVKPWMAYCFVLTISVAVGLFYQQRETRDFESQNIDQRERINEVVAYFEILKSQNAPTRFYDGLGLITDARLSPYFIGPGQLATNQKFPEYLKAEDFAILIETQKVQLLKNLIPPEFFANRIQDPYGVSRKAVPLKTSAAGEVSGLEVLNAVREGFSTTLNSESHVYLVGSTGDPVSAPWPEALKEWTNEDSKTFKLDPQTQYRITILPPFQSASRLSFARIFRFRRSQALTIESR
jgi:hypothetical protein